MKSVHTNMAVESVLSELQCSLSFKKFPVWHLLSLLYLHTVTGYFAASAECVHELLVSLLFPFAYLCKRCISAIFLSKQTLISIEHLAPVDFQHLNSCIIERVLMKKLEIICILISVQTFVFGHKITVCSLHIDFTVELVSVYSFFFFLLLKFCVMNVAICNFLDWYFGRLFWIDCNYLLRAW